MDATAFAAWVATSLGIAATLAVIVSAAVAMIKSTLGDLLPARYYSTVAVAVGLLLAYLAIPLFDASQPVGLRLFYGFLGGLTASGLFRSDKASSEPPGL